MWQRSTSFEHNSRKYGSGKTQCPIYPNIDLKNNFSGKTDPWSGALSLINCQHFKVLWPYLLECIVPEQYTDAMGTVCRSIGHIAGKKREEGTEDYEIDYEKEGNLPHYKK